jgi:uncharacterized OB-fold protein
MMSERKIKPMPTRDTAPYWSALAEGHLDVQHCQDCGSWTWPARPICSKCRSENMVFEKVQGTGEIFSWIVVHRSTTPDMMPYVPYTLALVRLDEQADIYIPGRLLTDTEAQRGMRVRAVPEKINDEVGDLAWAVEA